MCVGVVGLLSSLFLFLRFVFMVCWLGFARVFWVSFFFEMGFYFLGLGVLGGRLHRFLGGFGRRG